MRNDRERIAVSSVPVALAALALLACATASTAKGPVATMDVPDDLKPATDLAIKVGPELQAQNQALITAKHALMAKLGALDNAEIDGSIAQPGTDPSLAWTVYVLTKPPQVRIVHKVRLPAAGDADIQSFTPPQTIDPSDSNLQLLVRMRQRALDVGGRFTQPVNTLVLPAQRLGQTGWLIYLLGMATGPNAIALGRHVRVHMDATGDTVVSQIEIAGLATEVSVAADAKPKPLSLTHVATTFPMETHVFTSLSTGTPVRVATVRGVFNVDGTRISMLPDDGSP